MDEKKISQIPVSDRKVLIDKADTDMSVRRQCDLLQINRSSLSYEAGIVSTADQQIMLQIDKLHLKDPTLGSRRMSKTLQRNGFCVGRIKARSLMQKMGLRVIYRRPKTTIADPASYKYPYLLRGIDIQRPNQVWGIDITFVPMARGYMYMCAVIDLYSRFMVSWSISNTMDASWVCSVIQAGVALYGPPEIINSDQGSQFTSWQYISLLQGLGIKISMDGKGRAVDNVFIERFWRTLKHEKIYLFPPGNGTELFQIVDSFVHYYNHERLHQSLDYVTPVEMYLPAA